MEGILFDIRRFSTHDGDGIRTTVFLKGCPLHCRWCQNPEGIASTRKALWFADCCIHCRSCTDGKGAPEDLLSENSTVTDWEAILQKCPTQALHWDGRSITVENLIRELERDAVFYRNGGGVTLSGGEPLFQKDFSAAVLRGAKEKGFNTAIETSLFADSRAVDLIAPLADTIFTDCKILDDDKHRAATGQSNRIILDNLRRLLTGEYAARLIVRTPLVLEYTAAEENIAAISRYISGLYPPVRYELLNYNPLAAGKYPLVGRRYCFEENPPPYSRDAMKDFEAIAIRNGIKNLISTVGTL
ncbi:glycyl-radical enzyme activating protein [Spirochaetia bacterium]|nr:glycyl-radical enzyme activating protein [Spirochaetia bacterium]